MIVCDVKREGGREERDRERERERERKRRKKWREREREQLHSGGNATSS